MKVAIQGHAGSFHDLVARQWFGDEVEIVPNSSFRDVFDSYAAGNADAIVTAVENTIYGSINEVYQCIEDCSAPIVGEVKLAVDQMLIAPAGTSLEKITHVYSHPVALAQCRQFLRLHLPQAERVEYFDTSAAVEFIKDQGRANSAAIASEAAARLHGVPILRSEVQDNRDNFTRFLVLTPEPAPQNANRASLVLTTNHQPGALVEVLTLFATANVNLAKLQSQPVTGAPWQYKFFLVVDCAGEPLHKLLDQITASNHSIKLLGEYVAA